MTAYYKVAANVRLCSGGRFLYPGEVLSTDAQCAPLREDVARWIERGYIEEIGEAEPEEIGEAEPEESKPPRRRRGIKAREESDEVMADDIPGPVGD